MATGPLKRGWGPECWLSYCTPAVSLTKRATAVWPAVVSTLDAECEIMCVTGRACLHLKTWGGGAFLPEVVFYTPMNQSLNFRTKGLRLPTRAQQTRTPI